MDGRNILTKEYGLRRLKLVELIRIFIQPEKEAMMRYYLGI